MHDLGHSRNVMCVLNHIFKKSLKIPKGQSIRIRILKKNRQHNGKKKKYKRRNNDLQNIHTRSS